ncbi:uncharacterized protein FOMMEDRAFT_106762 [Fomitiporia mediterranea MF3/22]|uniref:uncharacterized protein n=1 Tax=Fomitiporia mediterranea (strain MF3/22) TaxID=694068 RepID=UPI0004408B2E|nr:uncharacterized protein FOMMEDRAFT_106762 [Fomitiporia mediterranea MF3/22]EJD04217.1 hypothetical protein FOMMEDRAFT_106762 [Fomitiporia mediterranea MF3/22]
MSGHSFPDPVFESLLEKLAHVLEVVQNSDSTLDPQTRQAMFKATTAFKDGLVKAKELANTLPGGEMLIKDQDDVIAMLEQLRDQKRDQLSRFSSHALSTSGPPKDSQVKMEVDSTASSPHD